MLFSHSGIPGLTFPGCSFACGTVLQILRLHSGQCGNCQGKARSGVGNCCGYCSTLLVCHQAGTGKALPMAGPGHRHARTSCPLARPNTKLAGPPCLWPDRDFNFARPPCLWPDQNIKFAGPRCLGRTDTPNSPDLPAYGRTVRQTYVRPAGPPCLWPDRPPALELTKLLNGGKGCSRRKHGYKKESGSRALLAFPFPLALYARVLSKPG